MPFDTLQDQALTDMVRLMVVRDGIAGERSWCKGDLGGRKSGEHCLLGWLLVATDWDEAEATRLAVDFLYPALPPKAQRLGVGIMGSLYRFNDSRGRAALLELVDNAIAKAQR